MPPRKTKYPKECDWEGCKKELKSRQLATFHNKLHREGRSKCTLCEKDFSRHPDLLRHMRNVHLKCTSCDVIFTFKKIFKAHTESKHKRSNKKKNKNKNENKIEPDDEDLLLSNNDDIEEAIEENVTTHSNDNMEEVIEENDKDYNLMLSDDDDDMKENIDENVTTYSNGLITVNYYNN